MHLQTFVSLVEATVNKYNASAAELEGDDGAVDQDDIITYTHQTAVADALAEMAKIILASISAENTITESHTVRFLN